VKAFLKAGILGEDRLLRESRAGTPQGSILSPLLSNVALSVLDEHIAAGPGGPAASSRERATRRRHGLPNYRLVRYADLCRARHKSAYAESRVMPILVPDLLVRAVSGFPLSA
jgi:RNA-directed DNA polymerase